MKVTNKPSGAMPNSEALKTKSVGAEAVLDNKKTKPAALENAGVASSTSVSVSSRAQDAMKAKELATPNMGVDDAKVARLQALIDKGEYKVNADAIAERMLDEHMKMPS
jgi:negative regulator of flagellin synthesis FlgM